MKLIHETLRIFESLEIQKKLEKIIGAVTGQTEFEDTILSRYVFVQTAEKKIENTDVETSHFNTTGCLGSLTIPARTLRKGSIVIFHLFSDLSNIEEPTNVMNVNIGETTILTSSSQLGVNSNNLAELYLELHIQTEGATGKLIASGFTKVVGGTNPQRKLFSSTQISINTYIDNTLDITYTWGAASESNILKCISATMQIIR